jgi:hypothetical protein
MLLDAELPQELWGEAAMTANYLRNLLPDKNNSKSPEELWSGRKPTMAHLRVWGCLVYMAIPQALRHKLDAVSKPSTFIGYEESTRQYRVFNPETRKKTAGAA